MEQKCGTVEPHHHHHREPEGRPAPEAGCDLQVPRSGAKARSFVLSVRLSEQIPGCPGVPQACAPALPSVWDPTPIPPQFCLPPLPSLDRRCPQNGVRGGSESVTWAGSHC